MIFNRSTRNRDIKEILSETFIYFLFRGAQPATKKGVQYDNGLSKNSKCAKPLWLVLSNLFSPLEFGSAFYRFLDGC